MIGAPILHGMEAEDTQHKKNHLNIDHLLAKDGKYLKQLIALENSGVFTSDLVYASGVLRQADKEDIKKYSPKALQLRTYIVQRIDDLDALQSAINKEDVVTIQNLVQQNPYLINARCFMPGNPCSLSMAVDARKERSVEKLLQLKANPNMCDAEGNTPLHTTKLYNIAKMLVDYGADVNKKNNRQRIPVFCQIRWATLKMIKLLGDRAKINKKDYKKNTVLHEAFKYGLTKNVIALLLHYGADLESRNYRGVTPFDICCLSHYEKYSDLLAEKGYLYFYKCCDGNPFILLRDKAEILIKISETPLGSSEWAKAKKGLLALDAYMKASIDRTQQARYRSASQCQTESISVNQHGCFLKNALYDDCRYFFGQENMDRMYTILEERSAAENKLNNAVIQKKESKLRKIIKKYGVDKEHQHRLMKLSIQCGDNAELSFYLKSGFDPDACEWTWEPLLFTAIERNNYEALQLLLDFGADFIVNNASRTPLEYMRFLGHDECISAWRNSLTKIFIEKLSKKNHLGYCYLMPYFLENGVDVNVVDDKDNTPLYYVLQQGCSKCIAVLLENNAKIRRKDVKNYTRILEWACENHNKEVITLCLNEGVLIYPQYIENESDKDIKKQLKNAYDQQFCMVCYDHPPVFMKEIPCANKHKNNFLCSECSNKIKKCPFGCGALKY